MPRKPVQNTQSRGAASEAGGGLFASIIERAFENPAMSGGLMVMAMTATAIVSNAMFLQNGRHPDPLFASHPAPMLREARPAPSAASASRENSQTVTMPPLPRISPARIAALAASPPAVRTEAALITDVQRELARLGLYAGAIDGLAGSRTAMAITAFERAALRPATGVASEDLLAAMKVPLPAPATQPVVTPTADIAATAAELDQRAAERAATIAAEQQARATAQMQANYRLIQAALNRIGYGPIAVDGTLSRETDDAIRRFELDNGLPVSGQASDELIRHLIAIGAIKPT